MGYGRGEGGGNRVGIQRNGKVKGKCKGNDKTRWRKREEEAKRLEEERRGKERKKSKELEQEEEEKDIELSFIYTYHWVVDTHSIQPISIFFSVNRNSAALIYNIFAVIYLALALLTGRF